MDDERLRAESREIEHLLGEIEELVPAPAWHRVERVLSRVIRLYGAGLARALAHARAAGAAEGFDERLAGDELLASLLVLHGLHPQPVEDRVRRALAEVRVELGLDDAALELLGVRDNRVALRAADGLGGGAMASGVAESTIRRVIETVAPEVVAIDIETRQHDPRLVQLRVRREAP